MCFLKVLHVSTLRHDSFDDDTKTSATLVYLPAISPQAIHGNFREAKTLAEPVMKWISMKWSNFAKKRLQLSVVDFLFDFLQITCTPYVLEHIVDCMFCFVCFAN